MIMQRFNALSPSSAMAVWYMLVILVVYGEFYAVVGNVIRENPLDSNTTPGSTVVLRCAVNNDPNQAPYTVYWYRHNPTDAYLTKGTQVFHQTRTGGLWQRLTVQGNTGTGEYFLEVQNIQMSDAGGYSCVYFQGDTYLGESRIATITVYVAPDEGYPLCSMEPSGVYLEPGQSVTLTCVSSGGTPIPRLDWMSWHEILPGRVEQDPLPKATYELQLTETDNGAVFTCVEDTPATPQLRTCSLKPFHRPTNVSITTSPVSIGEDAVFTCFGQGIPKITNYTWTVAGLAAEDYISSSGEKVFIRKDNKVLRIINVKADDNSTIVKCHANNEINEEGSASAVILISELLLSGKNMRPRLNDGQKDGAGISAGIIVGCLFLVLVIIGIIFIVRKHRLKNSTASQQDTETQVIENQPLRVDPTDEDNPAIVAKLQSNQRPVTICLTPRDAIVEHIRESEESGGQPIRPTDDSGSRVTVVGRLSCAGMTHDFGDIGVMYSKPIKDKKKEPEQLSSDNPKDKPETEEESKPKTKPKPALRPKPKILPKPVISAPMPIQPLEEPKTPDDTQDDYSDEDMDGENIYENMCHRPDITMDLGEEMEPYLRSKFTNWSGGQAKLL
ncbi:uncharacterized protein [Asterias amurensis]|uniref:uncharacterized protein n=1 Tax=Asterias amurensis TaxID=7602 RepID=UPI003AB897E9